MVNTIYIKNQLESMQLRKVERLTEKGLRAYYSAPQGKSLLKIDLSREPVISVNSYGQTSYDWPLIEPVGYWLQATSFMHDKIVLALKPFTELPDDKWPAFAVLEVDRDMARPNKTRYIIKLQGDNNG